jgi:hypothetical protein
LRAITSGQPDSVYVCHCKACQRRTGAVIHNGSRWLKSQVRTEGEHKIYGRIADSGFEIRFHFCPKCGSSVFWAIGAQRLAASLSAASPTRIFRHRPRQAGKNRCSRGWDFRRIRRTSGKRAPKGVAKRGDADAPSTQPDLQL